jgi:hypothetical protein
MKFTSARLERSIGYSTARNARPYVAGTLRTDRFRTRDQRASRSGKCSTGVTAPVTERTMPARDSVYA